MNFRGLGPNKKPFIYLDEFMPNDIDMEQLHIDMCCGIAKSKWDKKFVSSGVHKDWEHREITTMIRDKEKYLTEKQLEQYAELQTTEERIKFMTVITTVPYPYWVLFIRNNKRIEGSGIANKAIAADCHWTENAINFPGLVELIIKMPFSEVGRVILFMTEPNNDLVPHYDAGNEMQRNTKGNDDFIWFTTAPTTKKIFVMAEDGYESRMYPEDNKKFIWWNEMDYHGTDAVSNFTFSIRVEGKFKQKVKDWINNGN